MRGRAPLVLAACGALLSASAQRCLEYADERAVMLQYQVVSEGYDLSGVVEDSLDCCGGGTFSVTGVECASTHCGSPRAVVCAG
eukprot:COSAG01_NODE_53736_length_337_cov_0.621849_1_plen_83_part_10